MSEKRLALLCQHFYPEMISTGMHMTELATGLTQRGRPIRVYCARPAYRHADQNDDVPEESAYEGIQIRRMRTVGDPRGGLLQRGLFALSFLLATTWAVWRDRNRLYGILATTNPPFIGLAAVLLQRVARLPFATIVYDVYPDIAVRLGELQAGSTTVALWSRLTALIFNRSNALIVIGRDMARIVRSKLRRPERAEIALIPNWSDDRHIRPLVRADNPFAQQHIPPGHAAIQYSGRMGRTHNIEPLLEAAALLRDEPVFFQLIGDGAKRPQLEALAQRLELRNVQFLPYQPIEILTQVLAAPDLAVVCLGREFTGLSVPSKTYGIMAAGRPILAFLDPAGEIGLAIQETESGVVLPDPTAEQVAEVIRSLLADPERFAAMGARGREAFLADYTLSAAVRRYDQVLTHCFGAAEPVAQPTLVLKPGHERATQTLPG